ncbi:hypothetical protein [Brevundimonas sp.]|uniref:hypothetical protein n=1 Tax=Brevundimonas sp. TaxID=1871086 RepID=UPI002AB8388A|nr:hypothetical protein [Brevundimonas sp.]MDZ4363604.1 hypothetical protein [Brevundimonas sp.]
MASAFAPHASIAANRYLIVPCEAEGHTDLAIIWDRLEEQVVDVITAAAARYVEEDALWDEYHAVPQPMADFRMAA